MSNNILFLGRLFPEKNEGNYQEKNNMRDAENQLQWNLIRGLVAQVEGNIYVKSLVPIDSWPKHSNIIKIPPFFKIYDDKIFFEILSTCNITLLKNIIGIYDCKKNIIQWLRNNKDDLTIIVYSCSTILMQIASIIKNMYPNIVIIEIVADLPEHYGGSKKILKSAYNKMISKKYYSNVNQIDGFVYLSEHMKDKIAPFKPYIVVEGIAPSCSVDSQKVDSFQKSILYTGSLDERYGILELIEAFSLIEDEKYKLIICGTGNVKSYIEQKSRQDSRIIFLGKVNHEKVIELQKKATVLVNPRKNKGEYTKYSFPSKSLEYLASGTPFIGYKLDGIPEEYDDFIVYVQNDSIEEMKNTILRICELPFSERLRMGKMAQNFVLNKKNKYVQSRKIIDFIKLLQIQRNVK